MDVSIYRLRHRDILTLCVLALLGLGVVMVQSAAMNVSGQMGWRWSESGAKQALFAFVSIIAFFAIGAIDYTRLVSSKPGMWRQPIIYLLFIAAATCLIVLAPHIGIEKNGARRWLPLGVMQVQPSELGK